MNEGHYCARETTRNLIFNKLIPKGKIIDKKIGNSFHHLYINHKSKYNQIYKKLLNIEKFIEEAGPRLYRIRDDRIALQDDSDILANSISHLEKIYTDTLTDMLDLLYIRIPRDNLPQEDTESLARKIFDLKSKVHYYRWKDEYDRSHFNSQIMNIRRLEKSMKNEKVLKDFLEKKKIEVGLTGPLKELIDSFVKDFLI